MASAFVVRYRTPKGERRYRVRYRLGGRETLTLNGGSFRTEREAKARRDWVAGELAAKRVPELRLLDETPAAPRLREVAGQWRESRIDVTDRTATNHRVDLSRILPVLGDRDPATITTADVSALIAGLHEKGLARETIRKTLKTVAMVLDHAGRKADNPARDNGLRLPREDRAEVIPPTAKHVLAILDLLPRAYRLPALVLDATGMRVGELEALTWGDVDEIDGRWRVSANVAKTRQGRWVPVDEAVFEAVVELVPREDRDLAGRVFAGFGADRFRTSLGKACKHAGVPAFSPHDLRHRRATLWHLSGIPAAQAAAWLGHSAQEHLRTYAHATLTDRNELDYSAIVTEEARTRTDHEPPVSHRPAKVLV